MNLNRIIIIIFFVIVSSMAATAYELDLSVDEEIQKKYNSSKLNYEILPSLPKVDQNSNPQGTVPRAQPNYNSSAKLEISPINKSDAIKILRWTKFNTKSNQSITDSMRPGTSISFTTTSAIYKKDITIPTGTKLNGVIVNSHTPQITGNGGLVVLKINSITFNGKNYAIDGKITKANYKKIFFNNIKGKRQYISGIGKKIDKGETFYKKSKQLSNKFSNNPILVILSPLPTVIGVAGYTVNTLVSPITAITTKGGNLSIPAGSNFEIKLLNDSYIAK